MARKSKLNSFHKYLKICKSLLFLISEWVKLEEVCGVRVDAVGKGLFSSYYGTILGVLHKQSKQNGRLNVR